MNEADIRGAGLNNRDADRGVAATSGGDGMKEFGGKWKWSKKRGAMVLVWKRRKVKKPKP